MRSRINALRAFSRMTPFVVFSLFTLHVSLPQSVIPERASGSEPLSGILCHDGKEIPDKRASRVFQDDAICCLFTLHPSLFTPPKPSFRKGRAAASPYPESCAMMGKISRINALRAFSRMTPFVVFSLFTLHFSLPRSRHSGKGERQRALIRNLAPL